MSLELALCQRGRYDRIGCFLYLFEVELPSGRGSGSRVLRLREVAGGIENHRDDGGAEEHEDETHRVDRNPETIGDARADAAEQLVLHVPLDTTVGDEDAAEKRDEDDDEEVEKSHCVPPVQWRSNPARLEHDFIDRSIQDPGSEDIRVVQPFGFAERLDLFLD